MLNGGGVNRPAPAASIIETRLFARIINHESCSDCTCSFGLVLSDWNFLLNYGTLDFLVFCFLKDHLSPEEFAKVKDWHSKDRLRRIAQHLQEAKCPVEQQNEFAQLARRLEPIRELRNHLARGHMYFRIDEETRQPTVTVFRAKDLDTGWTPDTKHVEFPELLAGLKTLNELIEGFQSIAGFKPSGFTTASALS